MKLISLVFYSLIIISGCVTKEYDRQESRIGFFDENAMNLSVLNEIDGSIMTLVHIEDSESGSYRRTVWSPDGKNVAFTGIVDGVNGTFIANADGSGRQLIFKSRGNSPEGVLAWHEDLNLIFVMKNIDGQAEIYSVTNNSDFKNLTNLPSWEIFPTIFPDGRIAFFSNVDEGSDVASSTFKNAYVMHPDKKGYRFLLSLAGMTMQSVASTGIFPDISPDGKLMCFTLNGDIYIIGTDGRDMKNITNTPGLTELTPSFSLDGRSVLYSGSSKVESDFLSGNKPNINLFKVDLSTMEKRQLTFGESNFFTHPIHQPSKIHHKPVYHKISIF